MWIWAEMIKRESNNRYAKTGVYKIAKNPGRIEDIRYHSLYKFPYDLPEGIAGKIFKRDELVEFLDKNYKEKEVKELIKKFKKRTSGSFQKKILLSNKPNIKDRYNHLY